MIRKNPGGPPRISVIPAASNDQRDRALQRAMEHAAERGVTTVAHMSVPWGDLGAYLRAKQAGTLKVRAALYFPLQDWRRVADTVAKIVEDSEAGLLDAPKADADGWPDAVTWEGWQAIDEQEKAAGEPHGRPRVKLGRHEDLGAAGRRAVRSGA